MFKLSLVETCLPVKKGFSLNIGEQSLTSVTVILIQAKELLSTTSLQDNPDSVGVASSSVT